MTQSTLKPGVVTGQGYKSLVEAAKSGGYALPAVNVAGTNTINAVMEAAAKEWNRVTRRTGLDAQRETYKDWASKPNAYPR